MNFLDLLKFNRKDKEEVFFWFSVGGSMSSLNIALSVFSDTHVSVFTFISAITLRFLILHLSVIPGESDHVSYMNDKSSCTIYKFKSFLGSSLCRAHCSRIYPCIWFLSWSHHFPIWYYLCLPSFIQFLVTLVIRWRIYCLPHHSMVSHQHFLTMNT